MLRFSRPLCSLWAGVKPVPADPILGLVARFKADPNPNATNLAQGAYVRKSPMCLFNTILSQKTARPPLAPERTTALPQ